MLFSRTIKRDGTHEISLVEEWPDEDRISKDGVRNDDIFFLEEGVLRVVVKNGMATYDVYQEDDQYLYIRKITSQLATPHNA